MKKLIFALAALAVSLTVGYKGAQLYAQALIGVPSQANVQIIGVDPVAGSSCPQGGQLQFNIFGGNIWLCAGPAGITLNQGVASAPFAYTWTLLSGGGKGFTPGIGPAIASFATVAPTYTTQHITGTTPIVNITNPAGIQNNASVVFIFDAAGSWTAAGNIKAASPTIVAGSAYEFRYDAATAFWYPVF